jgi:flagellar protein FlgJ
MITNTTNSANTGSRQIVNDMSSLRDLRNTSQKDEGKALKEAAKAFEALFMQMMLKEARATKWSEGFAEGVAGTAGAMDKYTEWRDDQLAQDLSAKGSMGIADMLLKQLTPKYPTTGATTENLSELSMGSEISGAQLGLTRQYFAPVSAPIGGLSNMGSLSAQFDRLDRLSEDTGVGMPTAADTVMLRNLLLGKKD